MVATLEASVIKLSLAVLEQPVATNPWASPLIHFMDILGVWSHLGRLAWSVRPFLSGAIYIMRLMGLQKASTARQRQTTPIATRPTS